MAIPNTRSLDPGSFGKMCISTFFQASSTNPKVTHFFCSLVWWNFMRVWIGKQAIHQQLNGTESQRTPFSKSCDQAIRSSGFFRGPWVPWVRPWGRFLGQISSISMDNIYTLWYTLGPQEANLRNWMVPWKTRVISPSRTAAARTLREVVPWWNRRVIGSNMVPQIMNHQGLRALGILGGERWHWGVSVNSYVFLFWSRSCKFCWGGGSHSDARLHFCPLPVVIGNGESSGINFRLRPKQDG